MWYVFEREPQSGEADARGRGVYPLECARDQIRSHHLNEPLNQLMGLRCLLYLITDTYEPNTVLFFIQLKVTVRLKWASIFA